MIEEKTTEKVTEEKVQVVEKTTEKKLTADQFAKKRKELEIRLDQMLEARQITEQGRKQILINFEEFKNLDDIQQYLND